jgi:hypothetical protein
MKEILETMQFFLAKLIFRLKGIDKEHLDGTTQAFMKSNTSFVQLIKTKKSDLTKLLGMN